MSSCGDCEHYSYDLVLGPSTGCCRVTPVGETAAKKVRYNTDASKCGKFTPLERVVTDTVQTGHLLDRHLRPYKDHELENIDVNVDPENVKNEKYWG